MRAALDHAHTHSAVQDTGVSSQGAAAVEHAELAPSLWVPVKSLPRDCRPVPGRRGNTGSYLFVRYYVDDSILVEVQ